MGKRTQRRQTTSHLRLENLESRQLLAADLSLAGSEPFESIDVNQDGVIGPLDVIPLINQLNRQPTDRGDHQGSAPLDVNGDGQFSALDCLLVINRLGERRPVAASGSGDGGPRDGDPRHGDGPPGGDGHGHGQSPAPVRSIDGTDNNVRHSAWGSADEPLLRIASAEYADGVSEPAGADRPSAREISNLVASQSESVINDRNLSDFVWQWGQFLDHDIDLTHTVDPAESFPIEVPAGDPYFDPLNTGTQTIDLSRSAYETSSDAGDERQQLNAITAYIDGSNVYGSDAERAAALRTFAGGQLKTSEGDLLPFNEDGFDNAGGTSDSLFLAGDVRANEQVGLTAMHTLWVREHNRIAAELADRDPLATDEQLYQRARAIVIGEMQAITYNEFLPALLGRDAIEPYRGYDARVDPGISNVFSTAAYRFGHSMLSPELLRLENDGSTADEGNLALRDAFFRPNEITENGIDSLLIGLANQQAQEIDSMLVDDVRNFLFGPPGSGGFDLASLNIQRGRDHGLADYNRVREAFGLIPVTGFDQITSDPELQSALELAYGTVDDIDVWVGGLAEDHVPGASVGELVQAVLVDQFTRLRDGDRFWYQRTFRGPELRMMENTRLSDVIERNTEITGLQRNVFQVPTKVTAVSLADVDGSKVPAVSPGPALGEFTHDVPGMSQRTALPTPEQPKSQRDDRRDHQADQDRRDRPRITDLVFAEQDLVS